MDQPESSSDDARPPKTPLNLLGLCVGGDIKVFGPYAEQQIANGAAHHIGLKACPLQLLNGAGGGIGDQPAINAQPAAFVNFWLMGRRL
jgi:hypothetical protein